MPAFARLSLIFGLVGLLASRIGLLVHEFIGHGGVALLLGGRVTGWRLFLFGGGWIQYERAPWYSSGEHLAVALGGLALQSLVAALIFCGSRRRPGLAGTMLAIIAMLLWAHAAMYLSLGTHYGFGDGRLVRASLSLTTRVSLIAVLVTALVYLAYALTRQALRLAADLQVSPGARRLLSAGLAVLVAACLHYGLYVAEASLVNSDQTYAAIMQQELERNAALHMAELVRLREAQGLAWNTEQLRRKEQAYMGRNKPFALRPLIYLLCLLGAVYAALRHAKSVSSRPTAWRAQTIRAAALGLGLALVSIAVIDAFG